MSIWLTLLLLHVSPVPASAETEAFLTLRALPWVETFYWRDGQGRRVCNDPFCLWCGASAWRTKISERTR